MCVGVCVYASQRRGLSSSFPRSLGLALWFKAGQLIQGRTESEKECEEEEWATDGEKVGRMPDSIESLCTAFEVRGWGFRGKQDYSESIPFNNPGVWLLQRNNVVWLTTAVFFPSVRYCSSCVRHAGQRSAFLISSPFSVLSGIVQHFGNYSYLLSGR